MDLYISTNLLTEECFEDPRITDPEDLALRDLLRSITTATHTLSEDHPVIQALLGIRDDRLRAMFAHALKRSSVFQGHPFNAMRLQGFLKHYRTDHLPYEFKVILQTAIAGPEDHFFFHRTFEECVRHGPRDRPKYINWLVSLAYFLAIEGRMKWLDDQWPRFEPTVTVPDKDFLRKGLALSRFANAVECGNLQEALRLLASSDLQQSHHAHRQMVEIHRLRLLAFLDPRDSNLVPQFQSPFVALHVAMTRAMQRLLVGDPGGARDHIKSATRGLYAVTLHLTIILAMGDTLMARRIAASLSAARHDNFRRILLARALWLSGETQASTREYEAALQGASDMDAVEGALLWARMCGLEGQGHLHKAMKNLDFVPRPQDPDALLWQAGSLLQNEDQLTSFLLGSSQATPQLTLVGSSTRMDTLRRQIAAFSKTGDGILLEGESGSGKTHIARILHEKAGGGPFLTVSCSGIAGDLMASEFFGHVKGAFTGAVEARIGLFEDAGEGSVFLDDIQDMPPAMQSALLRVIEEREIRPVGSSKPRKIRCRILAATSAPLSTLSASGSFRDDLRHRLEKFVLKIPPLRDRREDIPELISHFFGLLKIPVEGLPKNQARQWNNAEWKGNIRELKNAVERWAVFHTAEPIPAAPLHPAHTPATAGRGLAQAKERLQLARPRQSGRRKLLLDLLRDEGPLTPKQLSEALNVTSQTIHLDLRALGDSVRKRPHSHLYEALIRS